MEGQADTGVHKSLILKVQGRIFCSSQLVYFQIKTLK